jgi:hypothetical protein
MLPLQTSVQIMRLSKEVWVDGPEMKEHLGVQKKNDEGRRENCNKIRLRMMRNMAKRQEEKTDD